MPIQPHRDDSRTDPARKVPAQRQGGYASTRGGSGAVEALPLDQRVKLDPEGGRLRLRVMRRNGPRLVERVIYFDHDEADLLRTLITRYVAPVEVRHVDPGAVES